MPCSLDSPPVLYIPSFCDYCMVHRFVFRLAWRYIHIVGSFDMLVIVSDSKSELFEAHKSCQTLILLFSFSSKIE